MKEDPPFREAEDPTPGGESALQKEDSASSACFDLQAIAGALPSVAETMLVDVRLTDEPAASSRVFRIYRDVPAHFHRTCDEYLILLGGRARFRVGKNDPVELSAGQMLYFRRSMVHSIQIMAEPVLVLAIDTPRRDPGDVTFVNAAMGTRESFLRTQRG